MVEHTILFGGFMKLKSLTTKELTIAASMVALSLILTFWEIPFNPGFGLKIDFALVPIILIVSIIGRNAGLIALVVQFTLVFLRNPSGWLMNATASILFMIPFILTLYFLQKIKHPLIVLLSGLTIATITTTILTTLANFALLIPLLFPAFALSLEQTITVYIPFNLVKFSLISLIAFIIIPQVKKYLHT